MKNIKHLLFVLALIFAGSSVFCSPLLCKGQQVVLSNVGSCVYNYSWALAFEENFDGSNLSSSRWQNEYPWGRILIREDNLEQQYYTGNNFEVSNGTLKLIAKKESVYKRAIPYLPDGQILKDGISNKRWFNYTSGMIFSKKLFGYGKYEIRCKIPKGKGFWPAFWTFGGSRNSEIDIFEFWNECNFWGNYDPSKLSKTPNFTVHYDYDRIGESHRCGGKYNGPDFSQSFHTFTMIWDNYEIKWYVDGQLKNRLTKFVNILGQQIGCNSLKAFHPYILYKSFPQEEFQHIIANLAVQSGSDSPDQNTPFPSSFEIDYIKYYKKAPCRDVIASSTNDFNLSNNMFNVIAGTSITLRGNVSIQSGQQLELIARDEITLSPGFTANNGSDFIARIDPSVCPGSFKMARTKSEDGSDNKISYIVVPSSDIEEELITKNQIDDRLNSDEFNFDVKAYPNPTNDILNLEIRLDVAGRYNIVLSDMRGQILLGPQILNSNKTTIDMTFYPSGIYTLQVIDIEAKKSYLSKVIKE